MKIYLEEWQLYWRTSGIQLMPFRSWNKLILSSSLQCLYCFLFSSHNFFYSFTFHLVFSFLSSPEHEKKKPDTLRKRELDDSIFLTPRHHHHHVFLPLFPLDPPILYSFPYFFSTALKPRNFFSSTENLLSFFTWNDMHVFFPSLFCNNDGWFYLQQQQRFFISRTFLPF